MGKGEKQAIRRKKFMERKNWSKKSSPDSPNAQTGRVYQ
jgi:hypothetical protein